jgi:hypothetical protein
MKPITVKIVLAVALGCAAVIIEAGSSQKMKPEVYLWIALGIVVFFVNKHSKTASKAPESLPEMKDTSSGPSFRGSRPHARQGGPRSGNLQAGKQKAGPARPACLSRA